MHKAINMTGIELKIKHVINGYARFPIITHLLTKKHENKKKYSPAMS